MENNWTSPTNALEIRSDPAGDGRFHAPRGDRLHNGLDLLCTPKQPILCPIACHFVRISNPYASDNRWHGVLLQIGHTEIFLWYLRPYYFRTWEELAEGEVLGMAQDISLKYGGGMLPHIHIGVKESGTWIDPMERLIA